MVQTRSGQEKTALLVDQVPEVANVSSSFASEPRSGHVFREVGGLPPTPAWSQGLS